MAAMAKELNLKVPIYKNTSRFGHFGRSDSIFPWEKVKNDIKNLP
jgi:S-adenosylmethionine synthetase